MSELPSSMASKSIVTGMIARLFLDADRRLWVRRDSWRLYQPALMLTHFGDSQKAKSPNLWRPVLEDVTVGTAIDLREDFDGAALRRLVRASKEAGQTRRLLALGEIYDGDSRTAAARIGGP